MASQKSIKAALDLLTFVEPPRAASADAEGMAMAMPMINPLRNALDLSNVVGVGMSEKISKKRKTAKLSLTFYVEKKLDLSKLKPHELIPATLPTELTGANETITTDIVEIGKLRPELYYKKKPIQPGFSIGHTQVSAGTLGAIVTDGKDNFILSNSHVLANSGQAKKGDAIIYPGKKDGGKNPQDLVAKLHSFGQFVTGCAYVNHTDCAIAKPTAERMADLISTIQDVGIPKGVIKPKRGMKVVKVGRTTGKTEGEIRDFDFRFLLDYGSNIGEIGFVNQVLCTRYTDSGDSGSLVIDQKSGKAVGLHFAGADSGSVFNPIDKVLECLNVKLVTKELANSKSTTKQTNK